MERAVADQADAINAWETRGLPPRSGRQRRNCTMEGLRELARLRERLQADFALIELVPHLEDIDGPDRQ